MGRMKRTVIVTLLILVLAPSVRAWADEPSEEVHLFHAALLLGGTHNGERNALTFGGDIEFRPTRPVGIGLTAEHVNEPFRENVWVVPVIVHPTHGLKLSVGPGLERVVEPGPDHLTAQHALLRVGASYEVPLGHGWTLDPDIAIDFVEGERVLVYAVAIGKEFGRQIGHHGNADAHAAARGRVHAR